MKRKRSKVENDMRITYHNLLMTLPKDKLNVDYNQGWYIFLGGVVEGFRQVKLNRKGLK